MTTPFFVCSLLALPYCLLSWLLVTPIFVRPGDSSALFASFVASSVISRSLLILSSCLFCRLVFFFFFHFLGLFSRRFYFRLLGHLLGCIFDRVFSRLIYLFCFSLFSSFSS